MQVMRGFLDGLGVTLAGLIITSLVAPLTVVAVAPTIVLFEIVRRRYLATSRELNRLNALALSPILSSFTESLQVCLILVHVWLLMHCVDKDHWQHIPSTKPFV